MTADKSYDKKDCEDCLSTPETSATALGILQYYGFSEKDRFKAVADVLRNDTIKPPPFYPGSRGCVQYGIAIAKHVLNIPKDQPVISWDLACELGLAEFISTNEYSQTIIEV